MKKLILALLLFAVPSFAQQVLRQTSQAFTTSGNWSIGGQVASLAGSCIILTAAAIQNSGGSGSAGPPIINGPSTPGFTWTQAVATGSVEGMVSEATGIWYISNAPAMSATLDTTVTFTLTGSGSYQNVPSWQMTEITGLPYCQLDVSGFASEANGGSTPINAGTLATSSTDTIFEITTSPYENPSLPGSGYTMLPNSLAAFQPTQYQLNAPTSSYATTYGNGGGSAWACVAAAFEAGSAPPSAVPRHHGQIL